MDQGGKGEDIHKIKASGPRNGKPSKSKTKQRQHEQHTRNTTTRASCATIVAGNTKRDVITVLLGDKHATHAARGIISLKCAVRRKHTKFAIKQTMTQVMWSLCVL